MFGALARLLAGFYALWPSYGFAIAALTAAVYLALLPLTLRQARAMTAMRELQPQLRALRDKHKGDRQRLHAETVALYQRHRINPGRSLLPIIVQLPVMVVMYRVIRGLTHDDPTTGEAAPRYLDHSSALYHALRDHGGRMVSAGMDLSTSALSDHGSILAAVPFFALAGLVVAAAVWQQRLALRRNTGSPLPATSQRLMRVMPAFSGLLAVSLPAGVTLYYLVSSLLRIGQQRLAVGQPAVNGPVPAAPPRARRSSTGAATAPRDGWRRGAQGGGSRRG